MSSFRNLYDPSDKPDNFEVLPAGAYTVKITGCEMKKTKAEDGEYLHVEMTVVEGEYANQKVFDRLNLANRNPTAVKIARSQFAALREAVGVLEPRDPVDLMGIRFQIVLKCEKRKDKPDQMTNAIQRYVKRGETPVTPQQNGGNAPWSRNAPNPTTAEPFPHLNANDIDDANADDGIGIPF